jgi:hypothetical protein
MAARKPKKGAKAGAKAEDEGSADMAASAVAWSRSGVRPYVTPPGRGGRWRDRFAAVCDSCQDLARDCTAYPELPLRLLLCGHNPSEHAFASGFNYSNPTNRMWPLLTGTFAAAKPRRAEDQGSVGAAVSAPALGPWWGAAPNAWSLSIARQNQLPLVRGVGLSDLGTAPGNDAAAYSLAQMHRWRDDFYRALRGHVRRCGDTLAALFERAHAPLDPPGAALCPLHDRKEADTGADTVGSKRGRPDDDAASEVVSSPERKRRRPAEGPFVCPVVPPVVSATAEPCPHVFAPAVCLTPAEAGRLLASIAHSRGLPVPRAAAECRRPALCAPRILAFTGKAQWTRMFDPPLPACALGVQPAAPRPPGWPHDALGPSRVFVLSSSSGRAAMTDEARREPYLLLAEQLAPPLAAEAAAGEGAAAGGPPFAWIPPALVETLEIDPSRRGRALDR